MVFYETKTLKTLIQFRFVKSYKEQHNCFIK